MQAKTLLRSILNVDQQCRCFLPTQWYISFKEIAPWVLCPRWIKNRSATTINCQKFMCLHVGRLSQWKCHNQEKSQAKHHIGHLYTWHCICVVAIYPYQMYLIIFTKCVHNGVLLRFLHLHFQSHWLAPANDIAAGHVGLVNWDRAFEGIVLIYTPCIHSSMIGP